MRAITYIGAPCKLGHTERLASNNSCVTCSRQASIKNYLKNRERKIEYAKRYQAENYDRIYKRIKEYEKAHPDKVRMWRRKCASSQKDAKAKRYADYYTKNTSKVLAYAHAYRARRKGAGGEYTESDLSKIYSYQGGRCLYCCDYLHDKWDVDHYIAISRGGSNYPSNIRLACRWCNRRKHARSAEDYCIDLLGGMYF